MKNIKETICRIFGHKLIVISDGGYCKRCGWFKFSEEYKKMDKIINKELKEIMVVVIEDMELARSIVHEHFGKGKITYANIINADKRKLLTEKIEELED